MIRIVPARDRHFTDFGWLQTYWLFSFSDYFDPMNIQFGALRVFNDDVVAPGSGFPTHPHEEMEIVTVVLSGEITHADSMGNRTVIRAGDVQRMSAGTGITHSEYNRAEVPVHFYQIWIYPDIPGLSPSYDQRSFRAADWKNRLLPVASGQTIPGTVSFNTDATIYRSDMEKGMSITLDNLSQRRIYVYLTSGRLSLNGERLLAMDQARCDLDDGLEITALDASEFILIDLPSCRGWGYGPQTLKGGGNHAN